MSVVSSICLLVGLLAPCLAMLPDVSGFITNYITRRLDERDGLSDDGLRGN